MSFNVKRFELFDKNDRSTKKDPAMQGSASFVGRSIKITASFSYFFKLFLDGPLCKNSPTFKVSLPVGFIASCQNTQMSEFFAGINSV